jgi:hypothetical protein
MIQNIEFLFQKILECLFDEVDSLLNHYNLEFAGMKMIKV